ncbi:MAG TPA: biotin carboxylase N-terminal domain-containing protein [Fimbriimonadales bacterium]|nr:biotin carboxylase N-terminal domain-containing protein [Fimbriimonadales bacterium]
MGKPIRKVLVANRGEIACRIFRTLDQMGIEGVAIFTEHDRDAIHRFAAFQNHPKEREAYEVSSYLAISEIVEIALRCGADAIHPGYGFLAENPAFVRACEESGIIFIGPDAEAMETLGDKAKARDVAKSLGLPVMEGVGPSSDPIELKNAALRLGAPLMLKAAAGGGGKGMKRILDLSEIESQIESSQRETKGAFGDDRLIIERYIYPSRHVEVQIFGDGIRAVALGERECSLQRRHQKVIEESPSTAVDNSLRERLFESAKKLSESVGYRNAGTCEFLLDSKGNFYFLEVNTRLQVEHPVTELCTGLDLVKMQIELACGGKLISQNEIRPRGHAIEARLNAEDPYNDFLPSAGRVLLCELTPPVGGRIDSGIGEFVTTHYDPLLAKFIAHGSNREEARRRLIESLKSSVILGVYTNQEFLMELLESDMFARGETYTTTLDEMEVTRKEIPPEILVAAALLYKAPGVKPSRNPWQTLGKWRME